MFKRTILILLAATLSVSLAMACAHKEAAPKGKPYAGATIRCIFPVHPWMAASVVITLPVLVIVFLTQRSIIQGLTAGAVKG